MLLIVLPVLSCIPIAIAVEELGASEGVARGIGLSPLLIVLATLAWVDRAASDEMKAFAAGRGWEWVGSSDLDDAPRGHPFTALGRDHVTSLARGEEAGRAFLAFEIQGRRRMGGQRVYAPFTCVGTRLDRAVPFVSVAKEAWFSTAADARLGAPVGFGGAFGRTFEVWSDDIAFARDALTPEVRDLLSADPDVLWRCDGRVVVAFRNAKPTADLAEQLLDLLVKVVDAAPGLRPRAS